MHVDMLDKMLANRLATLATIVDDAVHAETDGLSESAVAALQTVRQNGPTAIQDIARIIGLTHSATVRLIDRLEKDWLVRRLGRKGREVRVEATARGRRRAATHQERRLAVTDALIAAVDPEDRAVLARAVDKMLAASVIEASQADRMCRSCDRETCRHGGCPVSLAAEALPPPAPKR